jgi:inosine/xanthosine triphosphatase
MRPDEGRETEPRDLSSCDEFAAQLFHFVMTYTANKALIAIGSTRRPKVEAVREAISSLAAKLPSLTNFELVPVEVESGVTHTPLSREETMLGARQRAEALVAISRAQNQPWNYFVGLEGGLDVIHSGDSRLVFLHNWAYITDGSLASYGQSGGVLLPESLARTVIDQRVELAHAIDAFAGQHGIRDGQGAWGILTGGAITRQEAFRVAVISAFAPFLNRAAYSD